MLAINHLYIVSHVLHLIGLLFIIGSCQLKSDDDWVLLSSGGCWFNRWPLTSLFSLTSNYTACDCIQGFINVKNNISVTLQITLLTGRISSSQHSYPHFLLSSFTPKNKIPSDPPSLAVCVWTLQWGLRDLHKFVFKRGEFLVSAVCVNRFFLGPLKRAIQTNRNQMVQKHINTLTARNNDIFFRGLLKIQFCPPTQTLQRK